jgi:hypothetical protein
LQGECIKQLEASSSALMVQPRQGDGLHRRTHVRTAILAVGRVGWVTLGALEQPSHGPHFDAAGRHRCKLPKQK